MSVLQVRGDARCPEGVVPDPVLDAGDGRATESSGRRLVATCCCPVSAPVLPAAWNYRGRLLLTVSKPYQNGIRSRDGTYLRAKGRPPMLLKSQRTGLIPWSRKTQAAGFTRRRSGVRVPARPPLSTGFRDWPGRKANVSSKRPVSRPRLKRGQIGFDHLASYAAHFL